MIKTLRLLTLATVVLTACCCLAADNSPTDSSKAKPVTIQFKRGAWDASQWKTVRMANQPSVKQFTQTDDAITTNMETFSKEDYGRETDNAIMLYDLSEPEAQIDVHCVMGKGFGGNSCPGICIAPVVKDGVVVSSIAVFIADYTMAVWYQDTAPDGKTVRYHHLTQLGFGFDPSKPHVIRCRLSKKEGSVAIQVDDTTPVVLCFVGNKNLSFIPQEINPTIGLWGCHGECAFQEMTITRPGTLPFIVRTPPVK